MRKSCKIYPKLVQNPSKIDQKRRQIDKNASLERFRRQIAPESALVRLPDILPVLAGSLFGRKCGFKGRFWDPWNIENQSKNTLSNSCALVTLIKSIFVETNTI